MINLIFLEWKDFAPGFEFTKGYQLNIGYGLEHIGVYQFYERG
jgi:hypothetical protein